MTELVDHLPASATVPTPEKFLGYAIGTPEKLTDGPFHDIDPAELPDGRIVFTSTRIGSFEEYHNPPSRALFVMQPDGSDIRPITFTPIFDNEPKVTSNGRIAFIRTDNFFDRAKVETQIHVIRPDGTDLRRLTDSEGNDSHPFYSPDGNHILWSSSRFGFKDEAPLTIFTPQPYAELFIMNADGTGQRPLTDNQYEDGTPAWQPRAGARPSQLSQVR